MRGNVEVDNPATMGGEHDGHRALFQRGPTAWAEVAMRHGGTSDVRRALANVYGWFTEGQRAPDLQRAKAVLDRIDAGKV